MKSAWIIFIPTWLLGIYKDVRHNIIMNASQFRSFTGKCEKKKAKEKKYWLGLTYYKMQNQEGVGKQGKVPFVLPDKIVKLQENIWRVNDDSPVSEADRFPQNCPFYASSTLKSNLE